MGGDTNNPPLATMSNLHEEILVKQAVLQQVKAALKNNVIPKSWQVTTLQKILGIKPPKAQRVPLNRQQLIDAIKVKIDMLLGDMQKKISTKDIKDFIKNGGSDLLKVTIQGVQTTRLIDQPTDKDITDNIEHMQGLLNLQQTWDYLAQCNKFNSSEYWESIAAKAAKARKATNNTSKATNGNYISIPKEEAMQILAEHYNSLASGSHVTTPQCFRAAKVGNPTQHFQRLLYSTMFADKCSKPYNIAENVYKKWKEEEQHVVASDDAEKVISDYVNSKDDYLKELHNKIGLQAYIKAVLKKD
jgi:hypothetical protein